MKIGFIGQGWIGKNYADDFEARGYQVVRYALEEPYIGNKEEIAECDIVFIAVPTPTTPEGFDATALESALPLVGAGKVAVIKSTIIPGTTETLQKRFPAIHVFHSPEFLMEKTAAYDAAHPNRNLVGIPDDTPDNRATAEKVLGILPSAPYAAIMSARDAEFVKYAGNCYLYTKVIFMNVLYDAVAAAGGDWESVRAALIHDPRIGESHTSPVHTSGHAGISGRGAGGHCFIKDFEAFRRMYQAIQTQDLYGNALLAALKDKNIDLLANSGKDTDLLGEVYGDIHQYRRP